MDASLRDRISGVLDAGGSGELVVQKPSVTGRIYVARSAIAWAYCEGQRSHLADRLVERCGLERCELRGLLEECRVANRQFGDYLVDLGVIDEGAMRACLRDHVREHLTTLRDAPGPTRSLFLPKAAEGFNSRFVFRLDELLERPEPPKSLPRKKEIMNMSGVQETLNKVMELDGAFAAALVDHESGMTLGTVGGRPDFDIELAAAGNTAVVRSKMKVMESLGISGTISDILITLDDQYHLIRPLSTVPNFFLYLAIDKKNGNLGMARHKLAILEKALEL